jgi:hypothetical protein
MLLVVNPGTLVGDLLLLGALGTIGVFTLAFAFLCAQKTVNVSFPLQEVIADCSIKARAGCRWVSKTYATNEVARVSVAVRVVSRALASVVAGSGVSVAV